MKSLKILTPALLVAALFLAACTSSSSEPKQTPTTPVPPIPLTTFNVSVTASPAQLTLGSGNTTSTITVTVRRSDTGQAPPDLTPVTLTTTLGAFGNASGGQTVNLQLVGGQATAVLFPGTSAGTATIKAQVSQSAGAATVEIGQAATFFVGSVQPNLGSPQGGDVVRINGGGFVGPVRVTFGNATATVRSVTPDQIVAVVPSATAAGVPVGVGQSVPVPVSVTINVNQPGTASDSLAAGFTYALGGGVEQPQIFSVSPASGTNDGGTTVTINGTGFVAPVQVFFGTAAVSLEANVQSVSPSRIVVTTPAARGFGQSLANNPVDIRVKNVNTGFQTSSVGAFRFGSKVIITSFAPGQLAFDDTTTLITIHGQGFESPVSASIDKVAARVLSVSGTEVVVQSPGIRVASCSDVAGPVGVVNINNGDGDDTSTGDGPNGNFVYVVPKIAIASVSPSSGGEAGGDQVTVLGPGVDANTRVQFGDQVATFVRTVPGGIVVQSPRFTGTFQTQACVSGSQQGTMKIETSIDIKVTNFLTTCTDTSSKAFFYTPADRSCMVPPVTPPPPPPPPPPVTPPVSSFTFTTSGLTVIFSDSSTNTPTSWLWNFGDGATSNAQNPVHTYAAANTYVVSLTVTNAGGSSTSSKFVKVP
jgi:PKD repeat protein